MRTIHEDLRARTNGAQQAKPLETARPTQNQTPSESPAVPCSVFRLQRVIGNQATQRLLQVKFSHPRAGAWNLRQAAHDAMAARGSPSGPMIQRWATIGTEIYPPRVLPLFPGLFGDNTYRFPIQTGTDPEWRREISDGREELLIPFLRAAYVPPSRFEAHAQAHWDSYSALRLALVSTELGRPHRDLSREPTHEERMRLAMALFMRDQWPSASTDYEGLMANLVAECQSEIGSLARGVRTGDAQIGPAVDVETHAGPQFCDSPSADLLRGLSPEQHSQLIDQVRSRLDVCATHFHEAIRVQSEELQSAASADSKIAEMVFQVIFTFVSPGLSQVVSGLIAGAIPRMTQAAAAAARVLAPQVAGLVSALGQSGKYASGQAFSARHRVGDETAFIRELGDGYERGRIAILDRLSCMDVAELLIHWHNFNAIAQHGHGYYVEELDRMLERFRSQVLAIRAEGGGSVIPSGDAAPEEALLAYVPWTGFEYLALVRGGVERGARYRLGSWIQSDMAAMALDRFRTVMSAHHRRTAPLTIEARELEGFDSPPPNTARQATGRRARTFP